MKFQMLTNNSDRVKTRRFFVNTAMRELIHSLEGELSRLIRGEALDIKRTPDNACLADYTNYVDMRVNSLDYAEFTEFVDRKILVAHLKDYCDVAYSRFAGPRSPRLSFRMLKYSEPLLVDKEK